MTRMPGGLRQAAEVGDRNAGHAVDRVDAVELQRVDDEMEAVGQVLRLASDDIVDSLPLPCMGFCCCWQARCWRPPRSSASRVQSMIDEAFDVVAQLQGVLAHQPFGALGVARLERGDDFLVVDDRAAGAILLEDRALADGADVEEQIVGHLGDAAALRRAR